MHLPILCLDSLLRDFLDRRLLQIHNIDILTIELLVVPTITERPPRIEIMRRQFPGFLGILHRLRNLPPNKLTCLLVRCFIIRDIAERVEHETEAIALIPRILVDAFPLLSADVKGLGRALLEAERHHAVAHLIPDLVVAVVDLRAVLVRDWAVAGRHGVLGRALEADEFLNFFRDGGNDLHAGAAAANHADRLVSEIVGVWPVSRVVHLAFEGFQSRILRIPLLACFQLGVSDKAGFEVPPGVAGHLTRYSSCEYSF